MKRVYLILLATAAALVIVSGIHAQSAGSTGVARPAIFPPVPAGGSNPLFGQEHHYSLTFRGNGEAVVLLKALFSNQEKSPLSTLTFQVPKVTPEDLLVYQVIKDPICVRYRIASVPESVVVPVKGEFTKDPNCLEYRGPDYNDFLYGDAKFTRADTSVKEDTLEIKLPTHVAPDEAGAVLVYYRSPAYTARDFYGAYDYTFESWKVAAPVTAVTVGISVDADQILQHALGRVEYRQAGGGVTAMSADLASPKASALLNQYYGQVGQGQLVKQASNLAPSESFTVRGSYADSVVKLYGNEVTAIVLVIAAVIGVVLLLARFVFFKTRRTAREAQKKATLPNTFTLASGVVIGSFALSVAVAGFTIGLVFLVNNISLYSVASPVYPVALIFVAIVAVFIYVLLVLLPALILGLKRGLWWGVALFGSTVLWLAMYLVIVIFFLLLTRSGDYPQPYPPVIQPLQGIMEKMLPSSQDTPVTTQ